MAGKLTDVITWLDALLVTLWAILTALGARRGLSGFAWSIGGIAITFLANSLASGAIASTIIAFFLAVGLGFMLQRLILNPLDQPWHLVLGAIGGFLFGGVIIITLALSFPLEIKVTPQGKQGIYPSPSISPILYDAVKNSFIKDSVMSIWSSGQATKTLIIPDQAR